MDSRAGDFSIVRPVSSIDAAKRIASATDFQREALNRLNQLSIGQQLQGRVLTRFDDGSYLVQLANTAARMQLPQNANPGDSLRLQLLSHSPRPTFMMMGDPVPASQASMARNITPQQLLPGYQGTPAAQVSSAGNPNTSTILSQTGQLIGSLLQQPQATTLTQAAPVMAHPGQPAQVIAGALRDTIQFSGLFYESHVAEWAAGKRPITDLHKEPQQMMRLSAEQAAAILTRPDATQTQLGQIVQMQLQTADQPQVIWQGMVWPGLFMQWEMHQDPGGEDKDENGEPLPPPWHSVVRLQFEKLGEVTAAIKLHGKNISIQIRTENEVVALLLRSASKKFMASMEAAGSPLQSLTIKQDGPKHPPQS